MPINKVVGSFAEAVKDVPDGASIMIGGFGGPGGMPEQLLMALRDQGAKNLTIIANTAGLGGNFGAAAGQRYVDPTILVENGQVWKAIASFPVSPSPSRPTAFERAYLEGKVELELTPQGTLAERIRAGGMGIGGFYTPTGAGTRVAQGKETKVIAGREYILELGLKADYAFVRALKADTYGNLIYKGTSRNFNMPMATAAAITIAEVEDIVEIGGLNPERIDTPCIFVNRVVKRA